MAAVVAGREVESGTGLLTRETDNTGRETRATRSDAFRARLAQPVPAPGWVSYAGEGERFFRPTTLAELFALKAAHPAAQLVAGATEIGVEINKKFKTFPLLISTEGVPELTRITRRRRCGASVRGRR
jgi:xanthine dehydrogenase iron-sulfur cluster and FAD-binding subunit A